jgi:hypothetical protein
MTSTIPARIHPKRVTRSKDRHARGRSRRDRAPRPSRCGHRGSQRPRFAAADTAINLYHAFIEAGLVTVDAKGAITGWEATPWACGGSFAIVLARPDDAALKARVAALLNKLAADPAARIAAVVTAGQVGFATGNPPPSFFVNLKIGAIAAPYLGNGLPLAVPSGAYKGMHGYFRLRRKCVRRF